MAGIEMLGTRYPRSGSSGRGGASSARTPQTTVVAPCRTIADPSRCWEPDIL